MIRRGTNREKWKTLELKNILYYSGEVLCIHKRHYLTLKLNFRLIIKITRAYTPAKYEDETETKTSPKHQTYFLLRIRAITKIGKRLGASGFVIRNHISNKWFFLKKIISEMTLYELKWKNQNHNYQKISSFEASMLYTTFHHEASMEWGEQE